METPHIDSALITPSGFRGRDLAWISPRLVSYAVQPAMMPNSLRLEASIKSIWPSYGHGCSRCVLTQLSASHRWRRWRRRSLIMACLHDTDPTTHLHAHHGRSAFARRPLPLMTTPRLVQRRRKAQCRSAANTESSLGLSVPTFAIRGAGAAATSRTAAN